MELIALLVDIFLHLDRYLGTFLHDYGLWGTVPTVASDYPHAKPDSVGVPPQAGETVLVAPFISSR